MCHLPQKGSESDLQKWSFGCLAMVFQHGPRRVKLASAGCPRESQGVLIGSSRLQNVCSQTVKMPSGCPRRVTKEVFGWPRWVKNTEKLKFKNQRLICWLPLRSFMKGQKKCSKSVQNLANSGNLSLHIFSCSCLGQGGKT